MNNKEVTLLRRDGSVIRKFEDSLSSKDLESSKYIMVRSYNEEIENRNFFINKVSNLFQFDKAIIEYQMLMVSIIEDDNGYDSFPLAPVRLETTSISDVLTMLNCIDRLNCVNNLLCHEENCGAEFKLSLEYIGVTLYKNGNIIYDKYFKYKPSSETHYYSYKIAKVFSDIYSTNICNDLSHDNLAIALYPNMTWKVIDREDLVYTKEEIMIGLPLLQSNTFTFCSMDEYIAIKRIRNFRCTYVVHDSNKSITRELNECAIKGKYDELEEIGTTLDYFLDSYLNLSLIGSKRYFHIDFLSHMHFILTITNIVFNESYKVDENGSLKDFNIESVVSMVFSYRGKREKEIYFTEDSVIPISQIFNLLM